MKTGILTNGSMVKNHISSKTGFESFAIRRTSFLSWFQSCQRARPPVHIIQLQGHLQDRRGLVLHLLQARLHHLQKVILRLENERIILKVTSLQWLCQLRLMKDRGDPMLTKPIKLQEPVKKSYRKNGEVQTHEEAIVYVKELDIFLTMKVLENTPAVLSLGKLCDENGYSYEWINGQKPHLIKNGIRIICNTENFVPIVVPGLSSSSSGSSSTSRTPMRQESHSSSSSSSSPSSPTVGEIPVREKEDAPNSDISPVPVSELVDDRSVKPVETQANQIP